MKYRDYFKNQSLIILIDSKSTHNFIDPRVVKQANYFIFPQNNFEVMIGNGGKITCKGKYHNIKLAMCDYQM